MQWYRPPARQRLMKYQSPRLLRATRSGVINSTNKNTWLPVLASCEYWRTEQLSYQARSYITVCAVLCGLFSGRSPNTNRAEGPFPNTNRAANQSLTDNSSEWLLSLETIFTYRGFSTIVYSFFSTKSVEWVHAPFFRCFSTVALTTQQWRKSPHQP